ncbi:MAG: bifunctional heptose 7-phosphate kinase/heptose 1-phosphate adenyltransferase, partial [Planctomycetes bacterium]|nr:bifunctional heptose 7-phosphate kinase/heptose 1-phosphate adenyltransferase [Planctomycetota bacterium]
MYPRLIELVKAFSHQPVLLIGDLILDRYVYGDADRISPEAPVPVLHKRGDEDRVGGAGSVAVNLAELGLDVLCCGVVGLDDAGHRVRALLETQGISTRGVLSLADRPTTTKTRFVGLAQHRHRQQLIRVDDEVTRPLTEADTARCLDIAVRAMKKASIVCLEDYDKGLLSAGLCQKIIEAAAAEGKPVLVDPARLHDYGKYRGATVLTPNRSEFQLIAACPDVSLDTITAHVEAAIERCDVQGMLITLDREGCLLALRGSKPVQVPTRPRAVYDNTGAGDAVLAMLAAARIAGATWEEAAWLTNIAGGLEVEKFGCVPITRDEVLADLRLAGAPSDTKVRDLDDLAIELKLRKSRGQTVAFTNGCYDILHAGHVRFLNECRRLGNVVVVGLNSDASVRAQAKDANRPIVPQDQRAEVLAALQSVDYVVLFDEPTPVRVI